MTLFGWDASHYDGRLSVGILARSRAEGITFFTHKVAEGLSDTEGSLDDTALLAAATSGVPFVGGYFVPRSKYSPADQVAYWVRTLNAGEPWWRTHGGWFNQIDLERWAYDAVPASVGVECAHRMEVATGRQSILYASHGQYGEQLRGWDGPLWNADYTARPPGGFASMYPGDTWAPAHGSWKGGWSAYSGKAPAILQYTSSAVIAGLTTCDANAFRGTVADFAQMVGVTSPAPITPTQAKDDDMAILARGSDGVTYHVVAGFSHPLSAKALGDLGYLTAEGVYTFNQPPKAHAGEWVKETHGGTEVWIRLGWNEATFGPVVEVDPDAPPPLATPK